MINKFQLAAAVVSVALFVQGCATEMTDAQRNTGIGAGIGALGGAIIGAATGSEHVGRDAAIGAAAGALGGYVWNKKMEEQRKSVEKATAGTNVEVTRTTDDRLKINIPSDIGFDTGRADIRPQFRQILDGFAQSLMQNPTTTVDIVGHTDSTGSNAINDPLSLRRAESTRSYISGRGINSQRISVNGRGSREPIADNGSAEGRARNRRVDIFIGQPVS